MVAQIRVPRRGGIMARFPYVKDNRKWLKDTCRVKSPEYDNNSKHWTLSRNSLRAVIAGSIDRFGGVELYRDVSALSKCDIRCQQARGYDCDCSCYGENHGTESGGWIARGEFALIADMGDVRRVKLTYSCRMSEGDPRIYHGELYGRQYSTDMTARERWPLATAFVCTSCLTRRATVWDHCHTHGYVRAPLCNKCNTRRWEGWVIKLGRTTPDENVDMSYYDYCAYSNRKWCST